MLVMDQKLITNLKENYQIIFNNVSLLEQAFTHSSYVNEHRNLHLSDNERLEFLGDAVLELVTTEYLFKVYPTRDEGEMTGIRAALVNSNSIAEAAQHLDFNDYLLLSQGESKEEGKSRASILADSFEAFIGALYIDQGYVACDNFVKKYLINMKLGEVIEKGLDKDPKSLFQEKAQEIVSITPEYKVLEETGPDHKKHFKVGVFLKEELVTEGEGTSKHEGEVRAAELALIKKNW